MGKRERRAAVALVAGIALVAVLGAAERDGGKAMAQRIQVYSVEAGRLVDSERVVKDEETWRRELTRQQYEVAVEHGTERAFTGPNWDAKSEGVYRCVACGNDLFVSTAKFDSGTGWPSFSAPVHEANVGTTTDRTLWMVRTEVHCSRCGAHLGHVFDDGPRPTGLRYCVNGTVLDLVPMDLDGDGQSTAQ